MYNKVLGLLVLMTLVLPLKGEDIFSDAFRDTSNFKSYKTNGIPLSIEDNALKLQIGYLAQVHTIAIPLEVNKLNGKTADFSIEVKGENVLQARNEWNGIKFLLHAVTISGKDIWRGAKMPFGTFDWQTRNFSVCFTDELTSAEIILGFQDSQGTAYFRNLSVKQSCAAVDLHRVVNRTYADDKSGDGQGGWSDQGPDNDARGFNWKQKNFSGIPFEIIPADDPRRMNVLVMRSATWQQGPGRVDIPLAPSKAKYLYLLHTLCYSVGKGAKAGVITLRGTDGEQKIELQEQRDIANWWNPQTFSNAWPGAVWTNSSGGTVGVYISRFAVDPQIGSLNRISFESSGGVNMWIVLAASLSDRLHKAPEIKLTTIIPDQRWKILPRPEAPMIIPGSALDRSPLTIPDNSSRLVSNSAGLLEQEKVPGKTVRFLSGTEIWDSFLGRDGVTKPVLATHDRIEQYVQQLKRYGYSCTRLHFLDGVLNFKTAAPLVFNPIQLDRFDYLVYALKKNGMYMNLDLMSSGYFPESPWEKQTRNINFELYFDPQMKANWLEGVKKVLTHVNPYTQTRLIDEPLLSLATGKNEQEFAFTVLNKSPRWNELIGPAWQNYLSERYGTIDNLKKSWGQYGVKFGSFKDIPPFSFRESRENTPYGRDAVHFIAETEKKLISFYRNELTNLGWHGLLANFDMGKELYYSYVRNSGNIVFMHSYHAHPSLYTSPGSTIDQNSSIATAARSFRDLNGARLKNVPFVATEYGCVFWNQYRYEQSFVYGAYAALQDFSGLTYFGPTASILNMDRINPFQSAHDPISQASEFLTAYLFLRHDVKTSPASLTVNLNSANMFSGGFALEALHHQQSRLALVTQVSVAVDRPPENRPNEFNLVCNGGNTVIVRPGYSETLEKPGMPFDTNYLLRILKEKKFLAADNRTDFRQDIYESCTGELFMDCKRRFMSINTERFQGICGEAGSRATLKDLTIDEIEIRGNLSLVSIDGTVPIVQSKRLVMVYLTDALNSNMQFENPDRTVLCKIGNNPTLLATGKFAGSFRNAHAEKMKLYALELNGARRTLLPITVKNDTVYFRIDTAQIPGGPAVYFEFCRD